MRPVQTILFFWGWRVNNFLGPAVTWPHKSTHYTVYPLPCSTTNFFPKLNDFSFYFFSFADNYLSHGLS